MSDQQTQSNAGREPSPNAGETTGGQNSFNNSQYTNYAGQTAGANDQHTSYANPAAGSNSQYTNYAGQTAGASDQYTNPANQFAGGQGPYGSAGNSYSNAGNQYTGGAENTYNGQFTGQTGNQYTNNTAGSGGQGPYNTAGAGSQYTSASADPGRYGSGQQSGGRQEWQYFDGQPGKGKAFTYSVNGGDREEVEIDLGEIFGLLLHWAWLIILVALACGIAGYSYSRFCIAETFESTTKIYVLDKNDTSTTSTYTELQAGTQLTQDYAEMIASRAVLEQVMEDFDLLDTYTYDSFADKIEVDTPDDTRIVSITVTDTDPAMAQQLADAIRVKAAELIIETMEIDAVNTFEEANYPTVKSGPSNSRWALIAALLGAVLVIAVILIRYLMDDTIKTSEDVEHYLDISTIALIPMDDSLNGGEKKSRKKSRKARRGRDAQEADGQNSDSPAPATVRRAAPPAQTAPQPQAQPAPAPQPEPEPAPEPAPQTEAWGSETTGASAQTARAPQQTRTAHSPQAKSAAQKPKGKAAPQNAQAKSAAQSPQPQPAAAKPQPKPQRQDELYSIDDLLGEDDFDFDDDYDMNEPDIGGED